MTTNVPRTIYSLYELNEHLKRVIALNFSDWVWVHCELAQVDCHKGHYYFQLIEKESEGESIVAQSKAMLWHAQYQQLQSTHGSLLDEVLQLGHEVKLAVNIKFDERYGLSFEVIDIDLAYTLGALQLKKQATIQQLTAEGLLHRNKQQPCPLVIQRIAVLSSPQAAGYHDFINQLNQNPYGYAFDCTLIPISVQGNQVIATFQAAMQKLSANKFDVAVVVRGGGGKLDLSAFDHYEVAAAIAQSPIPIFTGIGHDTDEAVADMVAHSALKTPTAVAAFLIDKAAAFESRILQIGHQAVRHLNVQWQKNAKQITHLTEALKPTAALQILQHTNELQQHQQALLHLFDRTIIQQRDYLTYAASVSNTLDISKLLNMGFALCYIDHQIIYSAQQVAPNDQVLIKLSDGTFESNVK